MTSANHQPQIKFAPAAPPRSVAKAARLCSSLASEADIAELQAYIDGLPGTSVKSPFQPPELVAA